MNVMYVKYAWRGLTKPHFYAILSLIVVFYVNKEAALPFFTRRQIMKTLMAIIAFLSARSEAYHFNRKNVGEIVWSWLALRIFYGWMNFSGPINGTLVKGDACATPTDGLVTNAKSKYTRKMGVFCRVGAEHARAGYYVGFRPTIGAKQACICMTVCHDLEFMEKIGAEDCNFFAVDLHGNEISLESVKILAVSNNIILRAQAF
jgi:hypothetical protein